MQSFSSENRYELAEKFLPFCESLTHLDNADPLFTPIQAALHFRNFWKAKYFQISNNILHKNAVEAYKEQFILAEKRVSIIQSGAKLNIFDFQNFFFEKNCPGFSIAIFLMETFYEDTSMFFENLEDFVDPQQKNDTFDNYGVSAESQHKNGSFEKSKGFVDSHEKNDTCELIGDLAESHPNNGSFSIMGFFCFFQPKKKAIFAFFQRDGFATCNCLIFTI